MTSQLVPTVARRTLGAQAAVPRAEGIAEDEWSSAISLLRGAAEVTLVCHIAPDGDALGSMLGLGLALRSLGKTVRASWAGDPDGVPDSYSGLAGQELLVPAVDLPQAPELLVALDSGSLDRLGWLADRAAAASAVLLVDHHATSTRFGTVNLVDANAAATAELIAALIDRLDVELTTQIAAALYTGLVTDTGIFRHPSTSPAVHTLVARLLATGIPHDRIVRDIYETAPLAYVRLLGAACARSRLEGDAADGLGLVWTDIRHSELQRAGLELSDVEGVIDILRVAQEADVAAIFKEDPSGAFRVSVRSRGATDVGVVCAGLGGGGHRMAAGFTSEAGLTDTLRALRFGLAGGDERRRDVRLGA